MNSLDLYTALGNIDPDLIAEAATPKKNNIKIYVRRCAAAVFAILIAVGTVKFAKTFRTDVPPTTETGNVIMITPFSPDTKSPDTDSYGEDGLEHVDISTKDVLYVQLTKERLAEFGLPETLSENDFGEYLGTVTELTDENRNISDSFPLTSEAPELNGAKVYYYAPANCKAVIIATTEEKTSLFIANDTDTDSMSNYFSELFTIFGAASAEDIEKICFSSWNGEYTGEKNDPVIENGEIKSKEDIAYIYGLLTNANGKESDETFTRPNTVTMSFVLSNGLVMLDCNDGICCYMPFKGNGVINQNGTLTEEQNEKLKNIFGIAE